MTMLIRQEHDYGCGVASLAMIDGKSYAYVHDWLLNNWPGNEAREPDWLVKRGTYHNIPDFYLAEHGYATRYAYRGWYPNDWPRGPFAPAHLCQVVQPSGNAHYVVMRADGVVLDPLDGAEKRLTDWPEVNSVLGVWSVAGSLKPPKDGNE